MASLVARFDNNIQQIITKFNDTLELLSLNDKIMQVQSVDSLQINLNSKIIVKLIEELLNVTKLIKEKWILGQIHNNELNDQNTYQLYLKLNDLLDDITCEIDTNSLKKRTVPDNVVDDKMDQDE